MEFYGSTFYKYIQMQPMVLNNIYNIYLHTSGLCLGFPCKSSSTMERLAARHGLGTWPCQAWPTMPRVTSRILAPKLWLVGKMMIDMMVNDGCR